MFKPLHKWVFVRRDPMETGVGGVEVSEKALTKNYIGEISHIASDKIVTIGERVHVPHYGVEDVVVGNEEYAVFDKKRLFAVHRDGEWRPVNGYVKVRKCVNDHIRDASGAVALYMTEKNIETTTWVEILDVAGDCERMRREWIGYFCVSPESSELLCRILDTKDYMLHESLINFITSGE